MQQRICKSAAYSASTNNMHLKKWGDGRKNTFTHRKHRWTPNEGLKQFKTKVLRFSSCVDTSLCCEQRKETKPRRNGRFNQKLIFLNKLSHSFTLGFITIIKYLTVKMQSICFNYNIFGGFVCLFYLFGHGGLPVTDSSPRAEPRSNCAAASSSTLCCCFFFCLYGGLQTIVQGAY